MNILVIGNGFDLAHGLPTKYTDFLCFIDEFVHYIKSGGMNDIIHKDENGIKARVYIVNLSKKSATDILARKIIEELQSLINDNFWVEYFNDIQIKENWIDFESEISKVIQSLDNVMHRMTDTCSIDDNIIDISNEFLKNEYSKYTFTIQSFNVDTSGSCESITFKQIRNRLLDDLNKLIRAFEIYLTEYVEKIQISKISPDIAALKIDHIISFNYTTIFPKLYKITNRIGEVDTETFDYIHGKADIGNTIETNNMVLGIDEYLPDDRKNKDTEFIAFKKYYQRIYKGTGSKYKNWIDEIREDRKEIEKRAGKEIPTQIPFKQCIGKHHLLYIFGHSLDVTDKDILKDLILNDNVKTTIFYHNKEILGQQIANLVKVIGQDELIRRTGGSMRTIEFMPQKPMVPINQPNLSQSV